MSIFKRLSNIAKGQVKVWQKGGPKEPDAILEAELRATQSADRATRDAGRMRQDVAERRSTGEGRGVKGAARIPKADPVPRTDLFTGSAVESTEPPMEASEPVVPEIIKEAGDVDPFQGFEDPDGTWRDEVVDAEEPVDSKKRSL